MDLHRIDAALGETDETRYVAVATGALRSVGDAFRECFGESTAIVVADENTFAAAGRAVLEGLAASGLQMAEPIVFPGSPPLYADFDNVLALENALRAHSAVPVAVGSGTINDIAKLASHRVGRAYMCIATAASMDGYAAFGAAITKDGFKQTMSCPAPTAIVADTDVLIHAPARMNGTGYGDLLGKVTAGADWILADSLGIEPIDPRAWTLVQESLRSWTGDAAGVRAGNRAPVEHLFEGLLMSGLAMQVSQSSRPASGSEHRFSHLWEMEALDRGEAPVPHGFKVGVGTIAAAGLYEGVLARDLTTVDIDARCRDWPTRSEMERLVRQAHSIPQLAENAVAESLAKYIDADGLRERLTVLRERWPVLRERVSHQLVTVEGLRAQLRDAGCPVHPTQVGISLPQLRESYALARTIRRRYTILDLVYETGILQECLDEMFAPGGLWSGSPVS